jgi:chromosome segregation ATPase
MYLKSLTINGFKSFAKKGELEFSTPITAIVGPNGSGKSNVAEAFRFVLGEQSIKSMRGKKGEDLIFNGSESISRMNRASVAIALQNAEINGKRVFPLDFDEISIERVVHRDGTNEYLINGGKTRLKDVQELLASANIGPTGHHIISQGEADRILSANPRERREMIEDALGLKVFQFKKAESERKLKKTQENIAQVEALRREVAPHLKFLERQVKKIERSLELQNELKTVYAGYLRREDTYIAHHYDRLTAERDVPLMRLETLKRDLEAAKSVLASRGKDEKREALIELEGSMSNVRTKRQELTRVIGQLEGQILYLGRRIEDAKRKAETQEGTPIPFITLKSTTDDIETGVESAVQSNDTKILVRMLRDVVTTLRTLLKHAERKREFGDSRDDEREYESLQNSKRTKDEELAAVAKEEEQYRAEYETLKNAIDTDASRTRETEHAMFALMQEEREVSLSLDHIDRELAHLERDRDEFKRELQEAVSLLGRDAALYYEFIVKDTDGNEVARDAMVNEARTIQHERRRNLEKMKIRLEELGMGANDDVLKEYKDVKERDEFLVREVADLTGSVTKLDELIKDLAEKLNEQFITGIEKIGTEFNTFFILMFGGGSAKLNRIKPKVPKKEHDEDIVLSNGEELVEESEVEEGIELEVKLPNKKVSGLDMLSGGERALTSIALIFAMSQVNPPLFVILDETDAALDEANSRRYGDMISALAEKSQLILITHNRETMSRAGVLYGVTMAGDGVSKLLSVKFDEALAVAK